MSDEHADSRDERIGRVLNEYLDRKQRGESGCEQELLEAHPDLADELRAHFGTVRQVSSASPRGGRDDDQAAALPPDALPGYEILGEIHRGGQGVIYQALQKATRRKVAIKVMREGPFAGWRDRARFEREVQVLAALKHPSIVTIHDSGTAAGCHYFVMDYIAGAPPDVWVSVKPRSVRQILRLFVAVCDAVNAAHTKGIIHRDLKPGNIRIDGDDMPQILDFGLAKVAERDGEDAEPADMTAIGQFVGSLPWTSPEQAQGMLEQVDTRTDVYALGIILYQMLTGAFPYDVVGPMRDVLNRIVTAEPVRPSTLRAEIDRDVEAIILQCLRKEPHRRYQTAGELARDIERYLDGEPIAARSDSGLYVLGKMLRRYRAPVAVAAAFALLVGVSLVGSLTLWRRAVADRVRAVAAQHEQDRQRARADAKAAEAEQARAVAERERARVELQAEQLRRATYLNRIALAHNACENRHMTQARQFLDGCPADLRGWEWYYMARLSRQPVLLDVAADPECVAALAISPDGRRVVTGGCDGVIRIWDAATGAAITELVGHTDQVNALAFSPDGQWIASGSRDRTLRLWDGQTGAPTILEQGRQYINSVCFSPDGGLLVAGGQDRVLTFREVPGGRVVRTTPAEGREISCVAYSPDGTQVVTGEFRDLAGRGSRIRIWDAATGQQIRQVVGHAGAVLCVAYSPDGTRIASGGGMPSAGRDAQGTLRVFDSATGRELLALPGHDGLVEGVAFSPDGSLLASVGTPATPAFGMEADHTLKIWDTTTGAELYTYSAHKHGGRAVVWSPVVNRLFTGGMDGRLKAWPRASPPEALVLRGSPGTVLSVAFSPDGDRIVSGGTLGKGDRSPGSAPSNPIRVWDLRTASALPIRSGHRNAVLSVAWSPDGELLASGGADRTVRVWNTRTGKLVPMPANRGGAVESVAFSPDGRLLAAAAGHTVTLSTLSDGEEDRRLQYGDAVRSVSFSHDGRWLATGSPDGEIRVWDRNADGESRSIATGQDLNGAWFSPDSTTIASAHANGTIVLWDVSTGEQVAVMSSPRSVEWLDFSPDGRRIAACTADMMLRLWDVASATEVYTLRPDDAPVRCVRFSPDGTRIATCGADGLIKIWDSRVPPSPTVGPAMAAR